jgi:hypothetical protein
MALHEAAARGDADALTALLHGGADVDERDTVRPRERIVRRRRMLPSPLSCICCR